MSIVRSTYWIDHTLYNQFPDVQEARNLVGEEEQKIKAVELKERIPDIAGAGIGLLHRHWPLLENQNIIGHIEGFTLYSKPDYPPKIVCPTAWVATKQSLRAIEGVTNPSSMVSEIANKIHQCATQILASLPLAKEEEFSRFTVAIDPRIITGTESSHFLETNDHGMSVLNPILTEEEKIKTLKKDTILTHMTVDKKKEGIVTVECVSLCLGSGENHIRSHAYYNDPGAGG